MSFCFVVPVVAVACRKRVMYIHVLVCLVFQSHRLVSEFWLNRFTVVTLGKLHNNSNNLLAIFYMLATVLSAWHTLSH